MTIEPQFAVISAQKALQRIIRAQLYVNGAFIEWELWLQWYFTPIYEHYVLLCQQANISWVDYQTQVESYMRNDCDMNMTFQD